MALHPNLGPVELDGLEVWDRGDQTPAGQGEKVALISLRVGAVIGLNRAVRRMLGEARAVKLVYDPKRGRIGLASTESGQGNSYWIGGYSESHQISAK